MKLKKLIKRAEKLHRKLLIAEAEHDTKKAEKKHKKLLLTNLLINKKIHNGRNETPTGI